MQPVVDSAVESRMGRQAAPAGAAPPASMRFGARAARGLRNVPFQDWWVLSYLVVLLVAVLLGRGLAWQGSAQTMAIDIAFFVGCLVLVRGELLRRESYIASVVYRIAIFTPTFASYFQLRYVLPSITSKALDADIFAFDMKVFHYEPSVAWDRFVTSGTTEWFAFFYGLYFLLLSVHILPFLLFSGCTPRFRHFSNGLLIVFCSAHLLYVVVPGFGPYQYLHYEHHLVGGRFWGLIENAVHQSGALKDIFPSLHTAAPTYFTLYSFSRRKELPFKYTWPVMAFVTSQIVIATMFLRWHYLVDIVVGLLLAAVGAYAGRHIALWEDSARPAAGSETIFGQPILGFLLPKKLRWVPPT